MTGEPAADLVYVLDDDEQLCLSLAWLLESVHIRTEWFTDADAFLDAFDPDRPACLVLDVRMPGIGGFHVQELLNAQGAALPIVFVSAHGDIPMSVRALQAGAVDFLEKPYDPQRLLDILQNALREAGERYARRTEQRSLRERITHLSPREREILRQVVEGIPSKVIARQLGISLKTVDAHRARIREKTDADTLGALIGDMMRCGLRPEEV
ncbi:response regulator [Streptomyces sp. NBC_00006]|uniref:response regulator transcription factor n=1 Tax=unclassified Streptomyces TaxID=2593676 RepID=UPI00225A5817|nr:MULTISPECIES: response regulator [unclassified Streptomyces]MCX4831053.1 response regulator [Streptomyces sp. NBC_01016]MCX5535576.1 response regulator [Streptomyces sp. NBC_00006]